TQRVHEEGVYEWAQRSVPTKDAVFDKETDARKLFDRLAGAWVYWGIKGRYFETEEDAKAFYDELRYMLAMQMAAPNSPQWFNTGIHWAYGIEGDAQGHYYFDEIANEIKQSTSAYE
ncbi:MAG: ribonucleotide-diphosphate reductase subunit alpha, partial [Phototrophicales bacterium]